MQPARNPDGGSYRHQPQYYRKQRTIHQMQQLPSQEDDAAAVGNYYGDDETAYFYEAKQRAAGAFEYGYGAPQEGGEGYGYEYGRQGDATTTEPYLQEKTRAVNALEAYLRADDEQDELEGYLHEKTPNILETGEYMYSKSKQDMGYFAAQEDLDEYLTGHPVEKHEYPQKEYAQGKPKSAYYRRKSDADPYEQPTEYEEFKRQQSPALPDKRPQSSEAAAKTRRYYYRTPEGYAYRQSSDSRTQMYAQTEAAYSDGCTAEESTRPYYVVPVLYVPRKSTDKQGEYERYMKYYYGGNAEAAALEGDVKDEEYADVLAGGYEDPPDVSEKTPAEYARAARTVEYARRRFVSPERPSSAQAAENSTTLEARRRRTVPENASRRARQTIDSECAADKRNKQDAYKNSKEEQPKTREQYQRQAMYAQEDASSEEWQRRRTATKQELAQRKVTQDAAVQDNYARRLSLRNEEEYAKAVEQARQKQDAINKPAAETPPPLSNYTPEYANYREARTVMRPKSTLNRIEEDMQNEDANQSDENDTDAYKPVFAEKGVQVVEEKALSSVSTQTEYEQQQKERRSMIPSVRPKVTIENCTSDDEKKDTNEDRRGSVKSKKPPSLEQPMTRVASPVRRSRRY